MLECLDDVFGHIHAPAVGVHVEDDRLRPRCGRFLEPAANQVQRVVGNIFPDGDDADSARLRARIAGREQGQHKAKPKHPSHR